MRKRLKKKLTCDRCGVIHTGPRFSMNKVVSKAARDLADKIDEDLLEEILNKPLDTNPNF